MKQQQQRDIRKQPNEKQNNFKETLIDLIETQTTKRRHTLTFQNPKMAKKKTPKDNKETKQQQKSATVRVRFVLLFGRVVGPKHLCALGFIPS